MEQLWVKYKIQPDRVNRGQTEALRKASPAEVLAYAATLDGAETVTWCVNHKAPVSALWEQFPVVNPTCQVEVASEYVAFCVFVPVLVIPLPDKETTDTGQEEK